MENILDIDAVFHRAAPFKDNPDITQTKSVIYDIKSGKIKVMIIETKKPSPIAELGLTGHSEIVMPQRAEG